MPVNYVYLVLGQTSDHPVKVFSDFTKAEQEVLRRIRSLAYKNEQEIRFTINRVQPDTNLVDRIVYNAYVEVGAVGFATVSYTRETYQHGSDKLADKLVGKIDCRCLSRNRNAGSD